VTVLRSIAVPQELREAVSERAWLDGMLAAERALANAEAAAGVIPADAAAAIAAKCRAELYDWDELAAAGRAVANPAEPLVRSLRAAVGGKAARWVHHGATSQDVVDTAAMLVARSSLGLIDRELVGANEAAAALTRRHRSTPAAGRTLLQPAVPITFGLRAAGWLISLCEGRRGLRALELPAQLGGAAGTLAALQSSGLDVLGLYARELGLVEPVVPWHAHRLPVMRIAAALDVAAGALAKTALDIVLLAGLGEVAEASPGGSSTMPQKRNPTGSVLARACAAQVHAHASTLLRGEHELERAAGAWQAEWDPLSGALAFTGGAAAAVRQALEGLEVDEPRLRAGLTADLVAERAVFLLAEEHGRDEAHRLVSEAGSELAGLDLPTGALDPAGYLGSAEAFVDRALARYEEER
jgi:3-carboxy-cis,cis-muconate cycloisomerase